MATKSIDMMEQYDFYGSEGNIIKYLQSIDLCNDKYQTTFYCHLCHNSFTSTYMVGIIGCLITNIEHSINAKLLPTKCKHCKSINTNSFERVSSNFLSIPLLTIEFGHLPDLCEPLLLSNIDTHFTISHEDKV